MTKSETKAAMGYQPKPVHPMCSNCTSYRSDMVNTRSIYGVDWVVEKNIRCALGNFATKKTATCNKHEFNNDKK